jgi:hypothetical protein
LRRPGQARLYVPGCLGDAWIPGCPAQAAWIASDEIVRGRSGRVVQVEAGTLFAEDVEALTRRL